MATPVYHSGFMSTAAIGTNELSTKKWTVTPTSETYKTKNSRSGPIPQYEGTFQEYRVSIELDHDFANSPFQAPISIAVGTVLTNLYLYVHQSAKGSLDGPKWSFSSFYVETTPQSAEVAGGVPGSITGYGFGTFSAP